MKDEWAHETSNDEVCRAYSKGYAREEEDLIDLLGCFFPLLLGP